MPALATIRQLGPLSAASYALARAAGRVPGAGWTRAHIVAVPRAALPAMPAGFGVRAVSARQLADHAIDVDAPVQAARFAAGLTCLAAFNRRGALVGVVWLTAGPACEAAVPVRFLPPPGAAWDTGMWVHPDHRMGRAFAALLAGMGAWLDIHRLAWSISSIADYNHGSLAAHRRLGMRPIGVVAALRLGPVQWASGGGWWRLVGRGRTIDWQLPTLPLSTPAPPG